MSIENIIAIVTTIAALITAITSLVKVTHIEKYVYDIEKLTFCFWATHFRHICQCYLKSFIINFNIIPNNKVYK